MFRHLVTSVLILVLTACGGSSGGDENNRLTQALSFPLETIMTQADGEPITTQIATGGPSTGAITYTSGDTAVATVDARTGVVTIVKVGETIITATRARDARYQAAEASYTLTVAIARAIAALSFPTTTFMAQANNDPMAFQLASGGQGSGAISYTSSNMAVAMVHATTGVVTIVKAGETIITATRARDTRYQAAEASYTLTITLAMDTLRFPGETFLVTVGAEPITTQIATTGRGGGVITYTSSNPAVATVHTTTGIVTALKAGETTITATRARDARYQAAEASYSLDVIADTLGFTQFDVGDKGRDVCTTYYYTSGRIESICEHIGIESLFELDCDGDGSRTTRVLKRSVAHGLGGEFEVVGCIPTDKIYPDLPPLDLEEVAQNLQGAMSFSPVYIEDHGEIIETEERMSSDGIESATINKYTSGLVEITIVEQFEESQKGFGVDYNNDGDPFDFVHLRTVALDYFKSSEHLQILTEKGGAVLEDFGTRITNATRRIVMPEGIANFLRFNGVIDDIVIQIATTDTPGQYYVKIASNDPLVQLIIQKATALPDAGPASVGLRPDFFARTPLIEDTTTTSYAIYAVKGELYRTVLPQYPNFYVRYDFVNFLIPTRLQKTLDENRNIVVNAAVPKFLDYYDSVRVEFEPTARDSYFGSGDVFISPGHVYTSRPLIHEVAHGYHENFLPNGVRNEEIDALYALVSSDLNTKYGDEQNSYWRTNSNEFFAETLTTWLYLESEVVTQFFDPIAEVDSTFYYARLKPWFDNHFNKEN